MWEDILSIDGTDLYFCQQVDNQAIVIPETIDAIRALSGIEHDARASISKTDGSLGLVKEFHRPLRGDASLTTPETAGVAHVPKP